MRKISDDVKNPQSWCGLNNPEIDDRDADVIIFGIPFNIILSSVNIYLFFCLISVP